MIVGQDRAIAQFTAAWAGRKIHHAWLLAGPRGVGKASFAKAAATRVLAEAAGPPVGSPGIETPDDHRIAKLVAAESHPDMRWITRLPKEKGEGLARNITVAQVRALGEFFSMTPALSDWRCVVIDSIDELEASAANALLKMLEEPPPNSLFFLISSVPGRLLPTIRSRCRRLDFAALDDDAMTSILDREASGLTSTERDRIVAMSAGSAGRALSLIDLDMAKLEDRALAILREGDPTNGRRSELALELGKRGSSERYAAFLNLAPTLIAREARKLSGDSRRRALDAYDEAIKLATIAPRVSLDPASTVFQLGGILADVAGSGAASLKR